MSKEIEQLLPFYVNGTLSGSEQERVEKALLANPELQEELDVLSKLQTEMRQMELGQSPGELGLKRLQKSLTAETSITAPKQIAANDNIVKLGWKLAAVAACLMLVVQTLVFVPEWSEDKDLISAGGSVVQPHGRLYSITFAPDAREEDIRTLLLSVNGRFVDGPSALGVYRLSVPGAQEDVLKKLNARVNLIDSVQAETKQKPAQ